MTGHLFGDRYQVGDTLGFGGMSEVHRGRDLRLGRDVAIKVLRADLARDPSFQTRFRREAQNAASLNHPAIVAVYDTGETRGESGPIPYIVMEYVDGETLRDLLKREGSLVPKRAMEIVADVSAALDFSHRHGIVHRDIKPANVMLTRAGAVKVMDFGIARAVADGQATMTATAAVIGTAQYLSPEQARGEAVDARSDVYATGCVLFELLTGAPPFTGDSPVAVAYQHVREDPKAPSEVKPGLPKELDAIVLKALNKNPLNRYQTAADMRSDLVRALSGQAVLATPLMSDDERTQMMRATPARVGAAPGQAPLLAPPRRPLPEGMWEEEPEPDRAKRVWGFVGIGLLCAALLAGAIILTLKVTTNPNPPKQVAVPQVQGMTQAEAVRSLNTIGLVVGVVTPVESGNADKGKVTKQTPSQGTFVTAGDKVDLEVGKGLTAVQVPDLAGQDAAGAQNALGRVNLKFKQVQQISADNLLGKVISQNPAPYSQVPPNSTVTVTVGTGQKYVQVPADLLNISYDDAVNKLKAVGLGATKIVINGVQPKDQVISLGADHPSASNVPVGTVVTLNVSDNQLFVIPNITNMSVDSALAQLRGVGWGANNVLTQTTQPTYDEGLINTIQNQTPAAQSQINKNAPIAVVVAQAGTSNVPSLTGQSVGSAEDALGAEHMYNVHTEETGPAPTPALAGTVNSQSITPGDVVDFRTRITLTYYGAFPPPPTTKTTAPTTKVTAPTTAVSPPPKTTPTAGTR